MYIKYIYVNIRILFIYKFVSLPTKMSKMIKKLNADKNFHSLVVGMKWVKPPQKMVRQYLFKLIICIPYGSATNKYS